MISIIVVNLRVVTAVADVDGKLSIDCAEDSVTSVPLMRIMIMKKLMVIMVIIMMMMTMTIKAVMKTR